MENDIEIETRIDTDDLKITEVDGAFEIEVDDETETYKNLIGIGRALKNDATEQEAFELALAAILNQRMEKDEA
jgi:hypothetical protein